MEGRGIGLIAESGGRARSKLVKAGAAATA